jgi:hypothetical protein
MPATTHTFAKLYTMYEALVHIGQSPTTIAYAVAKNIKTIQRIIDENSDLSRKFIESLFDGGVKYKVVNQNAERLRTWSEGDELAKGETVVYDFDEHQTTAVNEYHRTVNEAEHTIDLHTIPAAKVEDLNLPANALVPLIGTIIIEAD